MAIIRKLIYIGVIDIVNEADFQDSLMKRKRREVDLQKSTAYLPNMKERAAFFQKLP